MSINGEIDLSNVERKTYLSFHQDGLLDILIGIFILGLGISMSGLHFLLTFIIMFVFTTSIDSFWNVKKSVIYPRLGYVNFSPERRAKEKRKLTALATVWVVPLVLVIVVQKGFPRPDVGPG